MEEMIKFLLWIVMTPVAALFAVLSVAIIMGGITMIYLQTMTRYTHRPRSPTRENFKRIDNVESEFRIDKEIT